MLEGMTLKDWLTVIPAYLGTATGTVSLCILLWDRKRQRNERSPNLELGFERQILDEVWLLKAIISNPGIEAIAFDALSIVSPPGLQLLDIGAVGSLLGAKTTDGTRRLALPKQDLIRTGEARRWDCYLRCPPDVGAPGLIEIEAEIRVMSGRERKRGIRRIRQVTT